MSTLLLSVVLVFGATIALAAGVTLWRKASRQKASTLPKGETQRRRADAVSAKVLVNRTVMNGPKARRSNQTPADVVLSDKRLLVATHHGRVLEITEMNPGSVRCTGPRRLVIEGKRQLKQGAMNVRVELIIDEAERWAEDSAESLNTQSSPMLT